MLFMKVSKLKWLCIIVVVLVIGTVIYPNYIYYMIPRNPLTKLDSYTLKEFRISEHTSENVNVLKCNDISTNNLIYKYIKDLELIPTKERPIYVSEDIYYRGKLQFEEKDMLSDYYYIIISDLCFNSMDIIHLNSNIRRFPRGYYKILDTEFDYEYIKDLIVNSQK